MDRDLPNNLALAETVAVSCIAIRWSPLWPVTSLKRPRYPKRLRSKIGSNRRPRISRCFGHLSYLHGYCYICTVRGARNLSAIVSITGVYIDPLLWNRFQRSSTDLAVLIPPLPFVLVVIVKWRRVSRNESRGIQDLISRETEFIIEEKLRGTYVVEMKKNDNINWIPNPPSIDKKFYIENKSETKEKEINADVFREQKTG